MDTTEQNFKSSHKKRVTLFFLLTFILSWSFFIIASLAAVGILPSALINMWYSGVPMPMIAAVILIYKEKGKSGLKELFRRTIQFKIKKKIVYLVSFLLVPGIFLIALLVIWIIEGGIPTPAMALWLLPIMFFSMIFSSLGEELGWRGYAFDPMRNRLKNFGATLLLAIIWVIWHLPVYIFVYSVPPFNSNPMMILGLCLNLLGLEFILTWIYLNSEKSIFTVILAHNVYNMCTFFFPNFAAASGALITGLFMLITAGVISLAQLKKNKERKTIK